MGCGAITSPLLGVITEEKPRFGLALLLLADRKALNTLGRNLLFREIEV
jgi:hypothetical protein